MALQTAEAPCPNDGGDRYVACGNGTVTDNETGLVWLANADCFGALTWDEAMEVVAGLSDLTDGEDCGLSDGSSPGEWRLASASEWKAMIESAEVMDCVPTITSDAGTGCWNQDCVDAGLCSFHAVRSSSYWSSSTYVPLPTGAWIGSLVIGEAQPAGRDTLERSGSSVLHPLS